MMISLIQAGTCKTVYVDSSMIKAVIPISGHEYEMYLTGGRCVRVRMFQREHEILSDAFRRDRDEQV